MADDATRRSEIALTFARLCPELNARWAEVALAPYDVMAEVARRAVADDAAAWVGDACVEAERLVLDPDPIGREVALLGFLENLQNVASHADTRAQPQKFEAMLGSASGAAWRRLNDEWASVAVELEGPGAVSLEQYQSVSNSALRETLQVTLRRMPDDRLVSVADVLRYEVRHGRGIHRAKLG